MGKGTCIAAGDGTKDVDAKCRELQCSDKYMREDAESMEWIQKYANDQDAFFVDFVDAYIRLAALGAEFA